MFRVVNVNAMFVAIQAGFSPYAANARGHYTIDKEIVDLVLNRLLAQIISSLTATLRFDGSTTVTTAAVVTT